MDLNEAFTPALGKKVEEAIRAAIKDPKPRAGGTAFRRRQPSRVPRLRELCEGGLLTVVCRPALPISPGIPAERNTTNQRPDGRAFYFFTPRPRI
jgi:hypothetical protein